MEGSQFDALSRRLGGMRSRRGALKAIAGAVITGLAGGRDATAQSCTAEYSPCGSDEHCCAGSVCQFGMCMPGCRIDGVFTHAWTSPPGDSCTRCLPEISTTSWSPVNEGMSCWSGDPNAGATVCRNGDCVPTGPATCPPPPPCHTDELINPDTCTYAVAEAGTFCGGQAMCHGGFAQPADTCDANGFCIGGGSQTVNCAPYVCGADACLTACTSDGDCVSGRTCCGGACVDLRTDLANCGACGADCPVTTDNVCLGAAICANGTCGFAPLPAGTACGDNLACNGDEACDGAGVCQPGLPVVCTAPDACHTPGMCDPGTGLCSPAVPTTDFLSDPNNCGDCGNVCPSDAVCCEGVCTTLGTDTDCAACGDACMNWDMCVNGECAFVCLQVGELCSSAEQCCQDEETGCNQSYANAVNFNCCQSIGSSCTSHGPCCFTNVPGGAAPVYCGFSAGVCGGPGAFCEFSQSCQFGVCCGGDLKFCCGEGEICQNNACTAV